MVSSDNPEISLKEFLKFIKNGSAYKREVTARGTNYVYYFGIDLDSYLNVKASILKEDYDKMDTVYSHLLQEMKDGSVFDDSENSIDAWTSYFYDKKKGELNISKKRVNHFAIKTLKKYIEEYLKNNKGV